MSRSSPASAPGAGGPVALGSVGSWIAPVLAIVGLLIVAFVTLSLLNGDVPFVGGTKANSNGNGNGNGNGTVNIGDNLQTPTPSNVVVVPDVVTFPGTIVYAKDGNIWVQTGKVPKQLTTGGNDSMPSWSPDGISIYFIRETDAIGHWPASGTIRDYQLTIPNVMRMKPDGSADPVQVISGKVTKSGRTWHAWIREPVLGPDGRTLAMVSDRPDPSQSDVILQFYDTTTKRSTVPKLGEEPPLGHQDPTWRSDGKVLLYVRNGRDGPKGSPIIYRFDVSKAKSSPLTGPGYLEPSYSPDGRFIAATKTSSFGNDLVILDANDGREVVRLTNDGASWAPVWSPTGDSIAFLHIQGQIVDLQLIRLAGDAPNWTVKDVTNLTEAAGLDGESRPSWYVPPDQLPTPTAAPTVGPSTAPSAPGPSGSTAPQ